MEVDEGMNGFVQDRGRLLDQSLACRYLAAQCLVGPFELAKVAF